MKYSNLVQVYEALSKTSKRLDKTIIVSELLKNVNSKDLEDAIYLLQGHIFPNWIKKKIGIASSLIIKVLANISSYSESHIENMWKDSGDLGLVAIKVTSNKKQATLFGKEDLTINQIIINLRKLVDVVGKGSVDHKIKVLTKLLTNCSPLEAKYLIRTVLEDLRIGLGKGSLKDALVWAYLPKPLPLFKNCNTFLIPAKIDCDYANKMLSFIKKVSDSNEKSIELNINLNDDQSILDKLSKIDFKNKKSIDCKKESVARIVLNFFDNEVQKALDASNDFYKVAYALKTNGISGLYDIEITPGTPIKVMLAQKVNSVDQGFESVGKPAAFEYKLDGFRMQIHKNKGKITLFTRRLENVTSQFPDVVKVIEKSIKSDNFIIDSEVVGIDKKTKKPKPFQEISQRIRRKYDIKEMIKELPVKIYVFDVMSYNNKSYLDVEYIKRRKLLTKIIIELKNEIAITPQIVTDSSEVANKFYQKALSEGHEGVMIKTLDAVYKPGSRVGTMVKLKPIMESLDLVIVEAEYGTGKRAGWFSSFKLACYDKKNDSFKDIGKVGTGFKEKSEDGLSFGELTKLLKKHIIEEDGRIAKIEPSIVIEIDYQEIQESSTYSSGFALRFPRLKQIRNDKGPKQASELSYIKNLFNNQNTIQKN